jgi:hypothetical protein
VRFGPRYVDIGWSWGKLWPMIPYVLGLATLRKRAMWSEERSLSERCESFDRHLPSEVVSGPGLRTTIMSVLLLDEDHPPYRTRVLEHAYELAEYDPPPADASCVSPVRFSAAPAFASAPEPYRERPSWR